ncbi:MAG: phospholipase D-like domain-containing protein [Nanoarchaeota archaeon]
MKKILIIFLILFVLAYFFRGYFDDKITGNVVNEIDNKEIPKEFGEINIYFCPRDDCEGKLVEIINKSSKVDCAFFDLDLKRLITSLKGKDDRLVIDKDNSKSLGNLSSVVFDNRKEYMHNKFCALDVNGRKFITSGSMNPTENDARINKNNLVVIESSTLYENYEDEFDELWNLDFGKGDNVKNSKVIFNGYLIENYFCPEDECEEKLIELIDNAKFRVYFMAFSFTSDKVGESLIKSYHYGLDVKGVFDKTQAGSKYSEFYRLNKTGLNVKKEEEKGFLHHKVFIVDDAVFLGSYNPTSSGNKANDENVLIIHNREIAEKFINEFNLMFS